MKTCSTCKEVKYLDDFYKDPKRAGGYQGTCKKCRLQQAEQYSKTDKGIAARKRARAKYKQSIQDNSQRRPRTRTEKSKELSKIYREKHRVPIAGSTFASSLRRKYSMTIYDWAYLYTQQNGLCGCCAVPLLGDRSTHIDHNHTTKVVRSLLCHNCNSAIGHAKESIERLDLLINYLKKHA